jgi:ferredoxin-NADP reductase
VLEKIRETAHATSIVLDLPDWSSHRAGQHVDVRLTAEDGYQAQRSYSIASAPDDGPLMLTIERLPDGEVSSYLADVIEPGDELELRGPIGGYFVWEPSVPGPLLLIAGGSGIVPMRAILRQWVAACRPVPARLLHSARSLDDLIYRDELMRLADTYEFEVQIALTREWPADWSGLRGRFPVSVLEKAAWPPEQGPQTFVCGPTGFVEVTASALFDAGQPAQSIKTERFGPTGG